MLYRHNSYIQSAFHTQKAVIYWKTGVNLWQWTTTGLNKHAYILIDFKNINGNMCILIKYRYSNFFLNSSWQLISNNSRLANKMLLRKDQQTKIYSYWISMSNQKINVQHTALHFDNLTFSPIFDFWSHMDNFA